MYLFHRHRVAQTLAETVIAVAILTFAVSGIYATFTGTLLQVEATTNGSAAEEVLIQRLDSLRAIPWNQLTSSTYLSNTFLATPSTAAGSTLLSVTRESVKITPLAVPYTTPAPVPAPVVVPPPGFTVTKIGREACTISPAGYNTLLEDQALVEVCVSITWTDRRKRSHQRELCAILAKAAINP